MTTIIELIEKYGEACEKLGFALAECEPRRYEKPSKAKVAIILEIKQRLQQANEADANAEVPQYTVKLICPRCKEKGEMTVNH